MLLKCHKAKVVLNLSSLNSSKAHTPRVTTSESGNPCLGCGKTSYVTMSTGASDECFSQYVELASPGVSAWLSIRCEAGGIDVVSD